MSCALIFVGRLLVSSRPTVVGVGSSVSVVSATPLDDALLQRLGWCAYVMPGDDAVIMLKILPDFQSLLLTSHVAASLLPIAVHVGLCN